MKKLVIGLVVVGMASFGFAQNSYPDFEQSKFRDFDLLGSDYEYLDEVQNGLAPNQAKYLEKVASDYDVTRSKEFTGKKDKGFNVTFKSSHGQIAASYDSKGRIVSTIERFSNIALPKPVGIAIARQYPKWRVVKNRYSVWYNLGDRTKRILKVRIQKGDRKKWLKVDPSASSS